MPEPGTRAVRVAAGEASKTLPTEDDHVKDFEREQLLERIGRESATIGVDIPEEIEVQGETIELQSFVFEIKRRDTIPSGERDRVENAKRNLRRERRRASSASRTTTSRSRRESASRTRSSGSTGR